MTRCYQRFDDAYTVRNMSPAERERFFNVFALDWAASNSSTFLSKLCSDVLGLVADVL